MRLYSYVVARDYGFAPNPFGGVCTLCTCKPIIRRVAQVGDWIVGTGSAGRKRSGTLVYAMRVAEVMGFAAYWDDDRFQFKKPDLRASKKRAFGDNIYRQSPVGGWVQLNSHHSFADGTPNPANIANDTQTDRVLIATDYSYWGGKGPPIPKLFRNFDGHDLCTKRGHKCNFPDDMVAAFIEWVRSLDASGFCGEPLDWSRTP